MQAIGQRSLSSFLGVLVAVGWWVTAVMLSVMLYLAVLPAVADTSRFGDDLTLDLPVSFSASTIPVTTSAPVVGQAEIRNVRSTGNLTFILGEAARSTLELPGNRSIARQTFAQGIQSNRWPHPDILILSGLVILVIAEVFRAGIRLQEDQSLTV